MSFCELSLFVGWNYLRVVPYSIILRGNTYKGPINYILSFSEIVLFPINMGVAILIGTKQYVFNYNDKIDLYI